MLKLEHSKLACEGTSVQRLKMNHNLVILLLLSHLLCNTSDQCARLYYKKNVQVQCDGSLNVSLAEPKTFEDCMEFCNASACTAILLETKESTSWCCVFGADHITYKYGSHIIYYKPFVEFHCHEYYQPDGCKECKKSMHRFKLIWAFQNLSLIDVLVKLAAPEMI